MPPHRILQQYRDKDIIQQPHSAFLSHTLLLSCGYKWFYRLQTFNILIKKYGEFIFTFLQLLKCFGFAGFQLDFSQVSSVVFILPGLCFHFLKHSFKGMSELCHLVIRLVSPLPPAPLPLLCSRFWIEMRSASRLGITSCAASMLSLRTLMVAWVPLRALVPRNSASSPTLPISPALIKILCQKLS